MFKCFYARNVPTSLKLSTRHLISQKLTGNWHYHDLNLISQPVIIHLYHSPKWSESSDLHSKDSIYLLEAGLHAVAKDSSLQRDRKEKALISHSSTHSRPALEDGESKFT